MKFKQTILLATLISLNSSAVEWTFLPQWLKAYFSPTVQNTEISNETLDNLMRRDPRFRDCGSIIAKHMLSSSMKKDENIAKIKQYILAKVRHDLTLLNLPKNLTHNITISHDSTKAVIAVYHGAHKNYTLFLYDIKAKRLNQLAYSMEKTNTIIHSIVWSFDSTRFIINYRASSTGKINAVIFDCTTNRYTNIYDSFENFEFPGKLFQSAVFNWHPEGKHIIGYFYKDHCLVLYSIDGKIIKECLLRNICKQTRTFLDDIYESTFEDTYRCLLCWTHPSRPIICFGDYNRQVVLNLDTLKFFVNEVSNPYMLRPLIKTNKAQTKLAILNNGGDGIHTIDIINLVDFTHEQAVSFDAHKHYASLVSWGDDNCLDILLNKNKVAVYEKNVFNAVGIQFVKYDLRNNAFTYTEKIKYAHDTEEMAALLQGNDLIVDSTQRVDNKCCLTDLLQFKKTFPEQESHEYLLTSDQHIDAYVGKLVADRRIQTATDLKKLNEYFNGKITAQTLSLDQALLLSAIGQQYTFDAEGPKGEPYKLGYASYGIFKTLPDVIQQAIKPLVVEHSQEYYAAIGVRIDDKKSFVNEYLEEKKSSFKIWQKLKQTVQSYKDNFIRV